MSEHERPEWARGSAMPDLCAECGGPLGARVFTVKRRGAWVRLHGECVSKAPWVHAVRVR